MRFDFITFFASALLLSSSLVSAIHLSRREHKISPAAHVLASRQHHVARTLIDVCINLNVDLLAEASKLLGLETILGPLDLGSKIHLCLCLKDLDIFLDTNADVQALVGLLGKNTVAAIITALINTSPEAHQCSLPTNAHRTCDNVDACHYACDSPYIHDGKTCVCAPPYMSCNGVCGDFPQGCGSAVPNPWIARSGPIVTIAQAKAVCKPHQTVCGVPERGDTLAFECVDVNVTKNSCGGCMTPHPFFEADPVPHSSGHDCSHIANAKKSECSKQRCVVHDCKDGWVPNLDRDQCVPDPKASLKLKKVQRRSDSKINATAIADVDSSVVAQLTTIGKLVSSLNCNSPASANTVTSAATVSIISGLISDVKTVTASLLASPTVSALGGNVKALLSANSLLHSTLLTCGCVDDLGLTDVLAKLEAITEAALTLQSLCAHNPIVPSSGSNTHPASPSSTDIPEQPINIGLAGLLSELGLSGPSGDILAGLVGNVPVTAIANVVGTVDPQLLAQIESLLGLVGNLQAHSSHLPIPSGAGSLPSINTNLVDGIVNGTIALVNAATSSSLVTGINDLAHINSVVQGSLSNCGCVHSLGLEALVADLNKVVNATLDMQSWCHTHAVATPASTHPGSSSTTPSPSSPLLIATTDYAPIAVGLSHLLTGAGVTGAVQSVNELGGGLDTTTTVNSTAHPDLLAQVEGIVGLVVKLAGAMAVASPSSTSILPPTVSSLLDPSLMANIVTNTAHLVQSPTMAILFNNIDDLVAADSALQHAVTGCACMHLLGLEDAWDYLLKVSESALELKSWCLSNPSVVSQVRAPVSSVSHPSGTVFSIGIGTPTGVAHPSSSHPTISIPSHSTSSPSSPSSTPLANDLPIVLDLDHLLSGLGLGGIKSVSTVNGLGSLSGPVNGLLDGYGIGPHARRRVGVQRQDTVKRRQITANVDATVNSDILGQIDALVTNVLGLISIVSLLPAAPHPVSSIPAPSGTVLSVGPLPTATTSGSNTIVDQCLVDDIVRETVALLSSSSMGQIETGTSAVVASSVQALAALDGCGCVGDLGLGDVYSYVGEVVNAALALEDLCHDQPATPISGGSATVPVPGTHPLSLDTLTTEELLSGSLNKLLNGLGLPLKADTVVTGLGAIDRPLDLLNDLGVSPSSLRRRVGSTEGSRMSDW
ncbi:hypothetical protein B0H34DRAFT_529480 [Crassisporium funariophilum]|nr:hypothetical protein B0H34DRAFT_529480 [Crassisporium funariophilum]